MKGLQLTCLLVLSALLLLGCAPKSYYAEARVLINTPPGVKGADARAQVDKTAADATAYITSKEVLAAAMETLAVVAYRPGIVRAEIEAIRGVQCGDLLRQLIERDLLRIVGRSSDLGRPLQYGTTKRFLELFGLADLSQLPTLSTIDQPNTAINQLPAAA